MACTNCGAGSDIEGRTVRFTSVDDEPRELELALCGRCVETFRGEDGIEVV